MSIVESPLRFDNRLTAQLPADPLSGSRQRQVSGACFSRVAPTPVRDPQVMAVSDEVVSLLGLDPAWVAEPAFAEVFGGNRLLDGMDAHAMCYGGHQFGNWAGQLGDGRAIALGEVIDAHGNHQMLQLKGAGPTPYSRSADGLAVLRSSIREFLCSEAMHHLGVPTTRALSLVTTGEQVVRDMLYDGHPRPEPGAVVCRVAPSFVRFGNFEILAARGDIETLTTLADFVLDTEYPDLADGCSRPEAYTNLLVEVTRRTALLMVEWLRVGFVHGVMNTDNMSILGLTIDYGPYGWLDDYDPEWTPNTTDAATRRYRFGMQPRVAQWNLVQLANALYPLVEKVEPLQEALDTYAGIFEAGWADMMAAKLGLSALDSDDDRWLADESLAVLGQCETDMTIFWRSLADLSTSSELDDGQRAAVLESALYRPDAVTGPQRDRLVSFAGRYAARMTSLGIDDERRRLAMNRVNPRVVLRNYLAQVAIDAAESGDPSEVRRLLDVVRRPYDEPTEPDAYGDKRPDWARTRVGCSQLSCSS